MKGFPLGKSGQRWTRGSGVEIGSNLERLFKTAL